MGRKKMYQPNSILKASWVLLCCSNSRDSQLKIEFNNFVLLGTGKPFIHHWIPGNPPKKKHPSISAAAKSLSSGQPRKWCQVFANLDPLTSHGMWFVQLLSRECHHMSPVSPFLASVPSFIRAANCRHSEKSIPAPCFSELTTEKTNIMSCWHHHKRARGSIQFLSKTAAEIKWLIENPLWVPLEESVLHLLAPSLGRVQIIRSWHLYQVGGLEYGSHPRIWAVATCLKEAEVKKGITGPQEKTIVYQNVGFEGLYF